MATSFVNTTHIGQVLPPAVVLPYQDALYYARVLHVETDHFNPPQRRPPAPWVHDHYHIVLVLSGKGRFHLDGQTYSALPGQVYFSSPPQAHSFQNGLDDTARYAEITFEFRTRPGGALRLGFHELLATWTNHPCRPVQAAPAPAGFTSHFLGALHTITAPQRFADMTDLEANWTLGDILRLVFTHFFFIPRHPPDLLEKMRRYIQTHFQEDLSLASLAQQADLAPNYFSRRFKAAFGRAPIDYLIDLRMRNACQLLRTLDKPLPDIAQQAGFRDVYYFSRLFRRRVGLSPGRYRRQWRG